MTSLVRRLRRVEARSLSRRICVNALNSAVLVRTIGTVIVDVIGNVTIVEAAPEGTPEGIARGTTGRVPFHGPSTIVVEVRSPTERSVTVRSSMAHIHVHCGLASRAMDYTELLSFYVADAGASSSPTPSGMPTDLR